MACVGCPPHAPHYGRCYNFNDFQPRCECKVEEPPAPPLGETCAQRAYADDDGHEDWLGDRSAGSSWLIHEEELRHGASITRT